ncbi:MAG: biotin-dependent carboxyltransferase family protein [Flavobacteriaceae bacterium]
MFKVLEPGFFTTIQDAGRKGLRDKGVPSSGYLDIKSAQMVNSLLENNSGDAILEITMTGPTLQFEEPTFIALGGAEMPAYVNKELLINNEVRQIDSGDVLSFGKLKNGFRTYLAIKGGIQSAEILGSRSYFKPLTERSRIKSGDEIPYSPHSDFHPKISSIKTNSHLKQKHLDVFPGPEFSALDAESKVKIFDSAFTIAKDYNRMAYQLQEKISAHRISMITSANLPGTVQLTPSGKLIILMRDGQTTGGYPRVLQLKESSISVLAQKKFGDKIFFKQV